MGKHLEDATGLPAGDLGSRLENTMSETPLRHRFRLTALGERGLPFLALMAAGWVFLSAAELPSASPAPAAQPAQTAPAPVPAPATPR